MNDELAALSQNQTWTLVPCTSSMNVVGSRWVFKVKLKANGIVKCLKERLVAKGYHQVDSLDFTETYSPVVKLGTIKLILSLATIRKWAIHQLNVKNAFLRGFLTEKVFMEQPPGFQNEEFTNHVCHLHKAIYGLKQAPRA